jgi:hypothetical protein
VLDGAPSSRLDSVFLTERYWPGVTAELFVDAVRRLERAAEKMAGEGELIRVLRSTLIPGEEVVLGLIQARSAHIVAEASDRAVSPVHRITEVLSVVGADAPVDEVR